MKNNKAVFALSLAIALSTAAINQAVAIDPRMEPLNSQQLKEFVAHTPIDSSQNDLLIYRAQNSHLAKTAYEVYTEIWKKAPNSPSTNLWRAIAADTYWFYGSNPFLDNDLPPGSPESVDLQKVAHDCFHKAYALEPNSERVEKPFAHYVFYHDEDMQSGLRLIRHAIELNPHDPQAHDILADFYRNPASPMHSLQKAQEELQTAIRLDPQYATPHLDMASVYLYSKKYRLAQQELNRFIALIPDSQKTSKMVSFWQGIIDRAARK